MKQLKKIFLIWIQMKGMKLKMQLVVMNNRPKENITILLCPSNMNKANEVLQVAQDLEVGMAIVMCKDLVRMAKNKIWHVNNMCGNNECAEMAIGWMSPCNTPSQQSKVVQKLQLQHNFGGSILPYSLRNHLYKVTLNICKGKSSVLEKSKRSDDYRYIKKMQQMGHHITLTQLWLKVTKNTQEKATPFENGILGVQKGYAPTTLLSFMKNMQ